MTTDLATQIKKADLRYITDERVGIIRRKKGEGFLYFDRDGQIISDKRILDRIKNLAIPPAWNRVWVCPSENGYLQATGIDDRGRKQYIYHPDWVRITQENKFHKLSDFGKVLPSIRKKVGYDMSKSDLSREKITATVIWLLEHTFIRVGNDEYARDNNSFGLTTLRNKHVNVRGKKVQFEFRGKSGIQHSVSITHPRIAKILKECIELPGYEIFQYLDNDERKVVDSSDINNYLKEVTGEDITAKDFRTWGGTTLSSITLHQLGEFEEEEKAQENIKTAVKKVSTHLRNTPTVCKNYYIHPTVFETYQNKILIPHFDSVLSSSVDKDPLISKKEYALLTLLQKYA